MANPLFNLLQGNKSNVANPVMNQFQSFMQNPMQFLLGKNINLPQNLQNDPKGAVQYLLNNGQMTQEQFNRLNTMASQMGIKLT